MAAFIHEIQTNETLIFYNIKYNSYFQSYEITIVLTAHYSETTIVTKKVQLDGKPISKIKDPLL